MDDGGTKDNTTLTGTNTLVGDAAADDVVGAAGAKEGLEDGQSLGSS